MGSHRVILVLTPSCPRLRAFDVLESPLLQIPIGMGRRAVLNVLRQGGETIAKMARAIAPVDEGNLRESIDGSTRLARSQDGDKGALAPVEMYVGPGQQPQAITQGFGTFKENGRA